MSILSSMVNLTTLQRNCIYFLVGCGIQIISLFLPWYTFKIASDISISGWNFYLFEQWKPIYTIQPLTHVLPNFSLLLYFALVNATYFGIGVSLGVIFLVKKEPTEKQTSTMFVFMMLGAIISIAMILALLIISVVSGFFVPYLIIENRVGEIVLTKTYSLSYGTVLSIVATSFLLIPFSHSRLSRLQVVTSRNKMRSPKDAVLTPTFVDVQKLEDKYLSIISQGEKT